MKKLLLVMSLILSIVFVGCGQKEEKKVEKKVYYVGTNAEYAPFEYLDNGKLAGFDIDLMNEVAKRAGIEIQWSDMSFDGIIPALNSGKIDISIAAFTITPERLKAVDFSVPYLDSPISFLTVDNKITDMNDIKGKKYGVQLGTTQESVANEIENATVVTYGTPAIAVLDLKSGKLDGVLVDDSVADSFITANPGVTLVGKSEGDSKAIVFNKKFDKAVLQKINEVIEEMKKDGTIDALAKKHKI